MIHDVFTVRNLRRNMVIQFIVFFSNFHINSNELQYFKQFGFTGMWAYRLAAADYQDLIDQGMRCGALLNFFS